MATSGTRGSQDGRVPPPGRSTSPAQAGSTRRPRRQPAPAAPTTGAVLTATPGPWILRPRAHAGLAAPQSIHDPRRLLGTLTQPPRPHCEGSTVCCPVCRCRRRLVPAPAAATTTAHLPGAGTPASAEPNRSGLAPPAGARCICREDAAHWPAGGGACGAGPIEFQPGSAAQAAGGGAGLLWVIQPQPRRRGPSRPRCGAGTGSAGRDRSAAAGEGEPGTEAATWAEESGPAGSEEGPSLQGNRSTLQKRTANTVMAVMYKS